MSKKLVEEILGKGHIQLKKNEISLEQVDRFMGNPVTKHLLSVLDKNKQVFMQQASALAYSSDDEFTCRINLVYADAIQHLMDEINKIRDFVESVNLEKENKG